MMVNVVTVPPKLDLSYEKSHNVCFVCGYKGVHQSYHKIPSISPIREKWIEALKIKEYIPSVRVCSLHFQDEDFRKPSKKGRKILHRKAIPSKFLTGRFDEEKFTQIMLKCNKKCCVCGVKDANLTYHTFPSAPNLRKKWADACGFKDHTMLRTKQICEKHFQREDYNYCMKINPKADKSRRTLRKDVVPSLLLGGNAGERKNAIINLPPPYKPLAPKNVGTLVLKNVNTIPTVTIPPTLTAVTPITVSPAVISSLFSGVVLGNQNATNPATAQIKPSTSIITQSSRKTRSARSKITEVVVVGDTDENKTTDKTKVAPTNSSSSASTETNSSAPAKTKSSAPTKTKSSAPTKTNPAVPIQTSSSTSAETNSSTNTEKDASVSTKENSAANVKSEFPDSKTSEDQSAFLSDDEDSDFSLEELILEEPASDDESQEENEEETVDENEVNSNSESNNQPANETNSTHFIQAVRPLLPTKYRPILPAPSLTIGNIKLIEALALKNGLRTDQSYDRKSSKSSPPLAWKHPSDIGPAHCSTPYNAWRAVQLLKSTIDEQKAEIKGLQNFKRRSLIRMQKMSQELKALKQKQKAEDGDGVEPWWV